MTRREHNRREQMTRAWGVQKLVAVALAAVILVPSFGTAWATRTPSSPSHVDPSLSVGEVALVHTSAGLAGALSHKLALLGATDIQTESAADMVIARLSAPALAAIAKDPSVTIATRDTAIVATGDRHGGQVGFEEDDHTVTATSADMAAMFAIRAPYAWTRTTGQGVTVAVLDTGIADHPDLGRQKVKARVSFVNDGSTAQDPAGHGTFIAGLIAANGTMKGVAPDADLVSVRVLDAHGNGTVANVVKAFDWLLRNTTRYHIDVVNLSWGAPQATTYHKDILSALVESLWLSGMTVVAAAGNDGPTNGTVTAPGADPFVITVGSFADHGTAAWGDDTESTSSGRGPTLDGFAKPDTLAPGEHVRSLRVAGVTYLDTAGNPVGSASDAYVHMTGTSAAAAFVSGVAALVSSAHRRFGPTQIKGAIAASGRPMNGSPRTAVDASQAVVRTGPANAGLRPSNLLLQILVLSHALRVRGVTWEGTTWDSVTRDSVTRDGVTWDGVTWDGVTWDGITWESVRWDTVHWRSISWETVSWETVSWEGVTWAAVVTR